MIRRRKAAIEYFMDKVFKLRVLVLALHMISIAIRICKVMNDRER